MTTQSNSEPQAIGFAFPFRDVKGKEIVDEHVFHDWLADEGSGSFPVSGSGMWHGGIHVSMDGAGRKLDLDHGVRCIADGEIVAYRANRAALASHIAAGDGKPAQTGHYSSSFALVRHTLEYPTDNKLTFFSLYMHLQSVAEYGQKSMQAPDYWARSHEVTTYAADKQGAAPHGMVPVGQVGLNIHAEPGSTSILGILARGSRIRIGEKSRNGRWGRIDAIESGVPMPPQVAGFVRPGAEHGWVYLGKERGHLLLNTVLSEAQCDQVVVPSTPIRINAGELIGHLGQYWLPEEPARHHRIVHIEVFCGDDLPRFLSTSIGASAQIHNFDRLPLLRIDKGVRLFAGHSIDDEGGDAPETAVVQIYSQAVLDALPGDSKGPRDNAYGDGQPWWKVASADSRYEDITGWVRNRQMPPNGGVTRESPHAWKDFETITGSDADNPTIFGTVDAWLDHALCENKPLTGDVGKLKPLACNVYLAVSPTRNESRAADEMRTLKANKWLRFRASRLIPKHRSEWASSTEYQSLFEAVFKRVAKEPYHDAELDRLKQLVWWDDVQKAVKGPFPSSPHVFHIHPIGMVGNFIGSQCNCINYEAMYALRGPAYRDSQITPYSHYNTPIDTTSDRIAGNSRRHGDATKVNQRKVIDILIQSAREHNLTKRDLCMVLAIARIESGFNPDAAAGTTSASGLGQFVDQTARHYGITNDVQRFDARAGSDALVRHFLENKNMSMRRYSGREMYTMIYAYHHDGPSLAYGGREISEHEVMPKFDLFLINICDGILR